MTDYTNGVAPLLFRLNFLRSAGRLAPGDAEFVNEKTREHNSPLALAPQDIDRLRAIDLKARESRPGRRRRR